MVNERAPEGFVDSSLKMSEEFSAGKRALAMIRNRKKNKTVNLVRCIFLHITYSPVHPISKAYIKIKKKNQKVGSKERKCFERNGAVL